MSPEIRAQFLDGHIPFRIGEIAFCEIVCRMLNQQAVKKPVGRQPVSLTLGSEGMRHPDQRVVVNSHLFSGVIFCRGMLEFLGVKWSPTNGLYSRKGKQGDDVMWGDFGVPPITIDEFQKHLAGASPRLGEEAVVSVIRQANKSVAHLTQSIEVSIGIDRLGYTCGLTNFLFNNHFFLKLGRPPIDLPKYVAPAS